MEIGLQFGFGMMDHCRSLIKEWGHGVAILSPRDLTQSQLEKLANDVTSLKSGDILVDPQFYLPHADHERLRSHDYWPKGYETGSFWGGPSLKRLLLKIDELNQSLGSVAVILPGLLAREINDDWLAMQAAILDEANQSVRGDKIVTIALSAEAIKSQEQIAMLLDASEEWEAQKYYLVLEHPAGQYLVDDPNWLANVLDLAAGLRIRGGKVILGYCNQQMLIASCCKVEAIASGTWVNVRSFTPEKFQISTDDEIKQRATWYYCPQTFSEYKIPFLDIAHRLKVLDRLMPSKEYDPKYVSRIFSGAQPSSIGLSEQHAFRHYLLALMTQAKSYVADSFDETVERYEKSLLDAEMIIKKVSSLGIRGQHRDFSEIIDVNRAALEVLKTTQGPLLRRKWAEI